MIREEERKQLSQVCKVMLKRLTDSFIEMKTNGAHSWKGKRSKSSGTHRSSEGNYYSSGNEDDDSCMDTRNFRDRSSQGKKTDKFNEFRRQRDNWKNKKKQLQIGMNALSQTGKSSNTKIEDSNIHDDSDSLESSQKNSAYSRLKISSDDIDSDSEESLSAPSSKCSDIENCNSVNPISAHDSRKCSVADLVTYRRIGRKSDSPTSKRREYRKKLLKHIKKNESNNNVKCYENSSRNNGMKINYINSRKVIKTGSFVHNISLKDSNSFCGNTKKLKHIKKNESNNNVKCYENSSKNNGMKINYINSRKVIKSGSFVHNISLKDSNNFWGNTKKLCLKNKFKETLPFGRSGTNKTNISHTKFKCMPKGERKLFYSSNLELGKTVEKSANNFKNRIEKGPVLNRLQKERRNPEEIAKQQKHDYQSERKYESKSCTNISISHIPSLVALNTKDSICISSSDKQDCVSLSDTKIIGLNKIVEEHSRCNLKRRHSCDVNEQLKTTKMSRENAFVNKNIPVARQRSKSLSYRHSDSEEIEIHRGVKRIKCEENKQLDKKTDISYGENIGSRTSNTNVYGNTTKIPRGILKHSKSNDLVDCLSLKKEDIKTEHTKTEDKNDENDYTFQQTNKSLYTTYGDWQKQREAQHLSDLESSENDILEIKDICDVIEIISSDEGEEPFVEINGAAQNKSSMSISVNTNEIEEKQQSIKNSDSDVVEKKLVHDHKRSQNVSVVENGITDNESYLKKRQHSDVIQGSLKRGRRSRNLKVQIDRRVAEKCLKLFGCDLRSIPSASPEEITANSKLFGRRISNDSSHSSLDISNSDVLHMSDINCQKDVSVPLEIVSDKKHSTVDSKHENPTNKLSHVETSTTCSKNIDSLPKDSLKKEASFTKSSGDERVDISEFYNSNQCDTSKIQHVGTEYDSTNQVIIQISLPDNNNILENLKISNEDLAICEQSLALLNTLSMPTLDEGNNERSLSQSILLTAASNDKNIDGSDYASDRNENHIKDCDSVNNNYLYDASKSPIISQGKTRVNPEIVKQKLVDCSQPADSSQEEKKKPADFSQEEKNIPADCSQKEKEKSADCLQEEKPADFSQEEKPADFSQEERKKPADSSQKEKQKPADCLQEKKSIDFSLEEKKKPSDFSQEKNNPADCSQKEKQKPADCLQEKKSTDFSQEEKKKPSDFSQEGENNPADFSQKEKEKPADCSQEEKKKPANCSQEEKKKPANCTRQMPLAVPISDIPEISSSPFLNKTPVECGGITIKVALSPAMNTDDVNEEDSFIHENSLGENISQDLLTHTIAHIKKSPSHHSYDEFINIDSLIIATADQSVSEPLRNSPSPNSKIGKIRVRPPESLGITTNMNNNELLNSGNLPLQTCMPPSEELLSSPAVLKFSQIMSFAFDDLNTYYQRMNKAKTMKCVEGEVMGIQKEEMDLACRTLICTWKCRSLKIMESLDYKMFNDELYSAASYKINDDSRKNLTLNELKCCLKSILHVELNCVSNDKKFTNKEEWIHHVMKTLSDVDLYDFVRGFQKSSQTVANTSSETLVNSSETSDLAIVSTDTSLSGQVTHENLNEAKQTERQRQPSVDNSTSQISSPGNYKSQQQSLNGCRENNHVSVFQNLQQDSQQNQNLHQSHNSHQSQNVYYGQNLQQPQNAKKSLTALDLLNNKVESFLNYQRINTEARSQQQSDRNTTCQTYQNEIRNNTANGQGPQQQSPSQPQQQNMQHQKNRFYFHEPRASNEPQTSVASLLTYNPHRVAPSQKIYSHAQNPNLVVVCSNKNAANTVATTNSSLIPFITSQAKNPNMQISNQPQLNASNKSQFAPDFISHTQETNNNLNENRNPIYTQSENVTSSFSLPVTPVSTYVRHFQSGFQHPTRISNLTESLQQAASVCDQGGSGQIPVTISGQRGSVQQPAMFPDQRGLAQQPAIFPDQRGLAPQAPVILDQIRLTQQSAQIPDQIRLTQQSAQIPDQRGAVHQQAIIRDQRRLAQQPVIISDQIGPTQPQAIIQKRRGSAQHSASISDRRSTVQPAIIPHYTGAIQQPSIISDRRNSVGVTGRSGQNELRNLLVSPAVTQNLKELAYTHANSHITTNPMATSNSSVYKTFTNQQNYNDHDRNVLLRNGQYANMSRAQTLSNQVLASNSLSTYPHYPVTNSNTVQNSESAVVRNVQNFSNDRVTVPNTAPNNMNYDYSAISVQQQTAYNGQEQNRTNFLQTNINVSLNFQNNYVPTTIQNSAMSFQGNLQAVASMSSNSVSSNENVSMMATVPASGPQASQHMPTWPSFPVTETHSTDQTDHSSELRCHGFQLQPRTLSRDSGYTTPSPVVSLPAVREQEDWGPEDVGSFCNSCFKPASFTCFCSQVNYCSKECQLADLKYHQQNCSPLTSAGNELQF